MNGKLFVLEGPDGSGKTTLRNELVEHIKNVSGINTIDISIPFEQAFGYNMIRQLLTKKVPSDILQNLILLNIKETIESVIKPSIDRGINVVVDRWIHSTIVYNTMYKGTIMSSLASATKSNNKTIDINKIYAAYFGDNGNYLDKYQPSMTLFLSVPELVLKLVSYNRNSKEINDKFYMMKSCMINYINYRSALKNQNNLYKGFKIIPDKSKIYSIVPTKNELNKTNFESNREYLERIFESNRKSVINKINKFYGK